MNIKKSVMLDIESLKIKYKISEDGKTVMLLSPNDPKAESAKEGVLHFGFNPQEISLGGPAWMTFYLDASDPGIMIDYLTSQLLQDKDAVAENFAVNANGKGQHRERVYIPENYPPPEWRKVEHLRFADEKACRYVTDYLKSIDFNEYYKDILSDPEGIEQVHYYLRFADEKACRYVTDYLKSIDFNEYYKDILSDPEGIEQVHYYFLEKTEEGAKAKRISIGLKNQDLSKEFAEHAKVLSDIKDEFVELLQEEYVSTEKSLEKPVAEDTAVAKKPVLKVQKRGELIKISQRNPESMQSVFEQFFYWIMDKLRGISDLKIETKIVEGEEKGTYQLKVMLSGRKAHEIESGIIDGEAQYLVHEAFNVDGKPEALRAFIDEVKKLNPEQQLETCNKELREMGITEQQQANLTVDLKDVYQDLSKKAQEALEKKCKKDVEPQNYKPSGGLLEKVSSKFGKRSEYIKHLIDPPEGKESGGPQR